MKKSKLAAAVRSANGRERLTVVQDKSLVRALGSSGYVIATGFEDTDPPDACPHLDYPTAT
jgi:hypothetical protein